MQSLNCGYSLTINTGLHTSYYIPYRLIGSVNLDIRSMKYIKIMYRLLTGAGGGGRAVEILGSS